MYNPFNTEAHEGYAIKVHGFELTEGIASVRYQMCHTGKIDFVYGQVSKLKGGKWGAAVANTEHKSGSELTDVVRFSCETPEDAFEAAKTEMIARGVHAGYFK